MGFLANIAEGLGQSTLNRQQTELLRRLEEEKFNREQEAQIAQEERAFGRQKNLSNVGLFQSLLSTDPELASSFLESPDVGKSFVSAGIDPTGIREGVKKKTSLNKVIATIDNAAARIGLGQSTLEQEIASIDSMIATLPPEMQPQAEQQKIALRVAGRERDQMEYQEVDQALGLSGGQWQAPSKVVETLDQMGIKNEYVRAKALGRNEANRSSFDAKKKADLDATAAAYRKESRDQAVEIFLSIPESDSSLLIGHGLTPEQITSLEEQQRLLHSRSDPETDSEVNAIWDEIQPIISSGSFDEVIPSGVSSKEWAQVRAIYNQSDDKRGAEFLVKRMLYYSRNSKDFDIKYNKFGHIPFKDPVKTEKNGYTVEAATADFMASSHYKWLEDVAVMRSIGDPGDVERKSIELIGPYGAKSSVPVTFGPRGAALKTGTKPTSFEKKMQQLDNQRGAMENKLEQMEDEQVSVGALWFQLNRTEFADVLSTLRGNLESEYKEAELEIRRNYDF